MDARVGYFADRTEGETRSPAVTKPRHSTSTLLLALAALIWAGMLIGISGMATPIKFTAPSLSLPVALEVGHVTFHLLSRVELALAGILFLIAAAARPPRWSLLGISIVIALIVAQAFWLLPELDVRVAMVIAGETPPPSSLHLSYIGIEIAKLAALLAVGISAVRRYAGAGA